MTTTTHPIKAVLFDFGGVLLSGPFPAFAEYEAENGLPAGFLRQVNAHNSDGNALARFERAEIDLDTFDVLFAAESRGLGHEVPGRDMLGLIAGDVEQDMVRAVVRIKEAGFVVALLTSSFGGGEVDDLVYGHRAGAMAAKALFDTVVDTSASGIRKPEPDAYAQALDVLGLPGDAVVYLDDLGVNLKPARDLGMRTIKVADSGQALAELESVLGIALR